MSMWLGKIESKKYLTREKETKDGRYCIEKYRKQ